MLTEITEDNLRWEGNGSETMGYYITCPKCKKELHGNWDREEFKDANFPNYCPHCGTKLNPPYPSVLDIPQVKEALDIASSQ